ncbi:hypothetical protein VSS86_21155, partial [Bacillus safensis]|uniref:hypothetical protein n=1 Tax=Bacillus safensis TaxID=561879 RepID=UPI002DD42207
RQNGQLVHQGLFHAKNTSKEDKIGKKGSKNKAMRKTADGFTSICAELLQSRLPPCQLPRRRSLWQYGKVSGFAKASLHEGGGCEQR